MSANCYGKYLARMVLMGWMLLTTLDLYAQEDPEYKLELGAGVGMMTYQGDFSSSLVKHAILIGLATHKAAHSCDEHKIKYAFHMDK